MMRNLVKATSGQCLIFAAFYGGFIAIAPWLHAYLPPTDAALVNRWFRHWVTETDGIETHAMLVGVTAALALGYLTVTRLDRVPWLAHPLSLLLGIAPALVIIGNLRLSNLMPLAGAKANLAVVGSALGIMCVAYGACRLTASRVRLRRLLLGLSGLLVGAVVVLAAELPSVFDYNFFIGPALKIASGEQLGTFYIQYNLIGTYLFRMMVGLGLKAHQMQAVVGAVFVLWLWLYYLLAARLFDSRFMVVLFMIGLFVVRFMSIDGGLASYPQVS